jgi:RNA polymerase sigma factor (sigma-70 family)
MTAQQCAPVPAGPAGGDPGHDGRVISGSVGDPEQFAAVFRRYAPGVLRYVTRRLGASAAEDVVAETFLIAFRQRSSFQPDRPDARPWLYGIATHLVGRHRRAEIRQYRALARAGADSVTEPFTDRVDERVSAEGACRGLSAALAGLPAGQRDALLLVAWADLTYQQAAQALGVPVGTVRSRLSRARAQLRHALGNDNPAQPGPALRSPANTDRKAGN